MPTPVNRLNPESGDSQVQAAISDCIAAEIRAGKPRDQAIAMCHEQAKRSSGKELGGGA